MLSPSALCDTYTLFREIAFDPENPFADNPPFNPDDPFAEGPAEIVTEGERIQRTVLTKVRLSESSGDRAVDARGEATAQQAILFFFCGISRADGSLGIPDIKAGDKLVEGVHDDLVFYDTSTVVSDDEHIVADDEQSSAVYIEATGLRSWTVKGAKLLKAKSRNHHMEVSLV
jgi:hypothetical protein